jgi:hypothetical protein
LRRRFVERRFSRAEDAGLYLAGWLFADLLLGAMLVFLAALPGSPNAFPSPTAVPVPSTVTPTPSATSTATATPARTTTQTPPPTPTPTPTASATPTASPTAACVRTATLTKHRYEVPNVARGGVMAIPDTGMLRETLKDVAGKQAGLVLTYVRAPGDGEGQYWSGQVNLRLREAFPEVFTAETIYEDFDYKDRSPANFGRALIEIYFVSNSCVG